MTEHEKLKEICDTIGYVPENHGFEIDVNGMGGGDILKTSNLYQWTGNCDVREIIFTSEFMKKYFDYMKHSLNMDLHRNFKADIFDHLDDPVDYLAKLIGLNK